MVHKVRKSEFFKFISEYPKKLMVNANGISIPPSINYYDEDGNLIAHTFAYSDDPDHYYYEPESERIYEIYGMGNFTK